jgi:hypothetical protein
MKEKKKTPQQQAGGNGGSDPFDQIPDATERKSASVSSGPYAEDLPVAGMTVGEVRKKFASQMDIAPNAQSIINGHPADETDIIKAGECLQFIQHAGEKGVAKVIIEGDQAIYKSPEGKQSRMPLSELTMRIGPSFSTGDMILSSGIKCILSRGNITLLIWEKPPHIARLQWISESSPRPFGRGTTYRDVRIALPYLIIVSPFVRSPDGLPTHLTQDECFFRNEPLGSMEDALYFPGLLNCSKWPDVFGMNHPLSWICTQYLKRSKKMNSSNPGERLQAGLEAVRYCLLETGFNLSSEHHEGNSWFGETKKIDPRISTVSEWEANTKMNPLFVLEVPWIPTNHTLAKFADRQFTRLGVNQRAINTSDDIGRIISGG